MRITSSLVGGLGLFGVAGVIFALQHYNIFGSKSEEEVDVLETIDETSESEDSSNEEEPEESTVENSTDEEEEEELTKQKVNTD